jgi:hypothetical protein
MNVMQHHYGLLRHDLRLSHCEAKTTTPEISSLYALAGDLEATFYPDDTPDPPFGEHAQRLRNVLTAAAAATDCPALAPTVDKIGAACEACHQQYR